MQIDETHKLVQGIWRQALGLEVEAEDNFFAMGGTSLLATQVIFRIAAKTNLDPKNIHSFLYEARTLGKFVEMLITNSTSSQRADAVDLIELDPQGTTPVRLSHMQEGMWFLEQLSPGSAVYNIPLAFRIRTHLNLELLRLAIDQLISRHDTLRTSITIFESGMPAQVVIPHDSFSYQLAISHAQPGKDVDFLIKELLDAEAGVPFDIARHPLFRIRLVRLTAYEHLLLFTLHHLIADGWSVGVLSRDLGELYMALNENRAPVLPILGGQYVQYAQRHRETIEREEQHEGQLFSYWREYLSGARFVLELPTDYSRRTSRSLRGNRTTFSLSCVTASQLRQIALEEKATIFMIVLAALSVLLSRYCAEDEVLIGVPMANRGALDTENIVGLFVNTLPIRINLSGAPTFRSLVAQVRSSMINAHSKQHMPFEKVVEILSPVRETARHPIFQVMLNFVDMDSSPINLPADWEICFGNQKTSKFDLSLYLTTKDNALSFDLEYDADLFGVQTAERISAHFLALLTGIASCPDNLTSELPLLNASERSLLTDMYLSSTAQMKDSRGEALADVLSAQVIRTPSAIAILQGNETLTYAELDTRANRLARYLAGLRLNLEAPVGVFLERGFDWVVAMLAIVKSGYSYIPLDVDYPSERLLAMVSASGIELIITTSRLSVLAPGKDSVSAVLVDRDQDAIELCDGTSFCRVVPYGALSYTLFTSGSTGGPKGVMIEFPGVVAYLEQMQRVFCLDVADAVLQVTSPSFDPSIREVFAPLCRGATLVLLPESEINDPACLMREIAGGSVSKIIGITPSLLRMLLLQDTRVRSSLCRLELICVSGELLEGSLCEAIWHRFGSQVRIVNLYGPTESTMTCCFLEVQRSNPQARIAIGRPISTAQAYVLDASLEPVPIGVVGELHIGGAGVARGYLGRPGLTAERFIPHPLGQGERLYRTGDMVRWNAHGELEFIGRRDQQVKIRGYRIELGEIEAALMSHESVSQAVAVAREDVPGEKRLVAYVVGGEGAAVQVVELRSYLKQRLPEYMVPGILVKLDRLPLTPNGKVDRAALPAPEGRPEGVVYEAPRTPTEEVLAQIWAQVLRVEQVGIRDDFFDLGGHSLSATRVTAQIRDLLQIELPLRAMFESSTLAELAERAERQRQEDQGMALPALVVQRRDGALQLSFAQERLWFLEQLGLVGSAYHVPLAIRLEGPLDEVSLGRSIAELIRRHESLRTRFAVQEGEWVQVIDEVPQAYVLPVVDLSSLPEEEREASFLRMKQEAILEPFDLRRGPLFRASVLKLGTQDHVLMLLMHHIVSDGWSMGIVARELGALYGAYQEGRPSPLAEPVLQYVDYALWQRQWLRGEVLERQLTYWKDALAGAPMVLDMPTDRRRPAVQSFRGAALPFQLSADLSGRLNQLGRSQGATLFMVLLAGIQVLLSRWSGQQDIVVGSPIAGRTHQRTESLVGFFVNTLALRTDLSGLTSFRQLLARVREVTLGAYAHQDVPFEKVVEAVHPIRDLSRQPLFQVVFALQNIPEERFDLAGLKATPTLNTSSQSKVDLTFVMQDSREGLQGHIEYATDLFEAGTIERLAGHFCRLLEGVVSNPDASVWQMPLLLPAERDRLLLEWNDTAREYPGQACVHELFEAQAQRTPEATAVVYGDLQLSYGQLEARSNQLARQLVDLGVGPEVVVGLCVERSIEMVVGLLGILKAGGAYLPLDPNYPSERLAFMLADGRASVVVTQERLADAAGAFPGSVVRLDADLALLEKQSEAALPRRGTAQNLAYVIYTSGSTGTPKGVGVVHRNVVRLVRGTNYLSLGPGDRFVHLSNIAFDASTFEVWGALLNGGELVLLSADPVISIDELAFALRKQKIQSVFLTTALFNSLALAQPDAFSTVRDVLFGGEAVDPNVVRGVLRAGAPQRLLHVYGPTECTTFSTWYEVRDVAADVVTVPIGKALSNGSCYVLDERHELVPVGVVGELHIGGAGVARGYLGRPGLTAERFIPHPLGQGERLYRTGDMVRWNAHGELEFIGRRDQQVKIRGYRIELGEIEAALMSHESVSQAVAVAREDVPGEKRLVAYVVGGEGAAVQVVELRSYLKQRLPEYMVPGILVKLDRLPLTPNGKVDRAALPAPEGRPEGVVYEAPRTPTEEVLAQIWAQVLRVEQVGIRDDFFDLGGHSLSATRVTAQIRDLLQIELPLRAMFESSTLAELAERAERQRQEDQGMALPALVVQRRDGALQLSFAQERLWFLEQLGLVGSAYHVPLAIRLEGPLDEVSLGRSIAELIRRHESLRTRFAVQEGEWVQVIDEVPQAYVLPVVDLSSLPEEEREASFLRMKQEAILEPFDLRRGPLFRASVLKLGTQDHVLMLLMHHIVSDGWSMGIVARELGALYGAYQEGRPSPLAEPVLQYVDYALWQRQWLRGEVLERQLTYWKDALAGAPMVLDMPTDRRRPAVQSFRGAALPFQLSADLSGRLNQLGRSQGATLFMVLLAGIQVLLSRWSGQQDIVVGSPIAGRTHQRTESLVGFFVNTLALRTDLSGLTSFRQLLARVREVTLGAYAHQDVPFEKVVEAVHPIRDLSRQPLFQVVFALQNIPEERFDLAGLKATPTLNTSSQSKVDLTFVMQDSREGLQGHIEYATDLFEAGTIERLAGHFCRLLEGVVSNPDASVWQMPLLLPAERDRLLLEWNDTAREYPGQACVHELFEAQAQRTPEATAVVYGDLQLSYGQLEARSNQLARQLVDLGVGPEVVVGLCVERSIEMVVGLLGILKAGGAYLPLDPNYPSERLAFMLADGRASVVVTQERLADAAGAFPGSVVRLDADLALLEKQSEAALPRRGTAQNLAYVIYTSGSTGTPKGVGVVHRNVVNFIEWARAEFAPEQLLHVWATTSLSFDVSVFEIFVPLCGGGRIEVLHDVLALADAKHTSADSSLVCAVPSALASLVNSTRADFSGGIDTVILAGESLSASYVDQIRSVLPQSRLLNFYGPTEATVYATGTEVAEGIEASTIGRPIGNAQAYVLDASLEPVPIGVVGELHIGGAGVARGYLGRPGLTAERFIPHPLGQGERLYRTGDMVRWNAHGELEFIGRRDQQVKIRGYRIELGEIEAALMSHESVSQAVAVAREDVPGEKRLVAYVVGGEGAAVQVVELRSYLKQRLPEYMVPGILVKLDRLPLTPNGKVDRAALPAPEGRPEGVVYEAPRTPTEEVLAQIWAQVLRVEQVGIRDDFFDLGGHSLSATIMLARVEQEFGTTFPLVMLFEAPILSEFANRISIVLSFLNEPQSGPTAPDSDWEEGTI